MRNSASVLCVLWLYGQDAENDNPLCADFLLSSASRLGGEEGTYSILLDGYFSQCCSDSGPRPDSDS